MNLTTKYAEAKRVGDDAKCRRLRERNADDPDFQRRANTLDELFTINEEVNGPVSKPVHNFLGTDGLPTYQKMLVYGAYIFMILLIVAGILFQIFGG